MIWWPAPRRTKPTRLSDDDWYHPNHCAVFAAQGIAATAPTIPQFQLNVVEEQTERLLEKVRYGAIDTAIIALSLQYWRFVIIWVLVRDVLAVFTKDSKHANLPSINADELANR